METKKTKEVWLNAYEINTLALNNTSQDIILCADSYQNGEAINLCIVFKDITLLEWISNHEINKIKENLKKRIDEL